MHRIDGPGATVDNKFTDGDPVAGVQATLVTDDWLNDVQEELMSLLSAGDVTPVKGTQDQVLRSIRRISSGIVGQTLNLKATIATAAAAATWTADELIVESALGGLRYCLAGFNKTITLTGPNGAGGMDTGSGPVSSYVGIYAIYNPTTGVSALIGVNGGTLLPEVYGGVNMPAGFTASALVSVWPTNASGQMLPGSQRNRDIVRTTGITVLSGSSLSNTFNPVTISAAVPVNAKTVSGVLSVQATSGSGGISMNVASDTAGTGAQGVNGATSASNGLGVSFHNLVLTTPQLIYFNGLVNGPTAYSDTIAVNRYSI